MKRARLRFYEELNEYLPEEKRKQAFTCCFEGKVTVAGLLDAVGVPLSAVDLILVNDESVARDQALCDGDRLSCYPVFERFDIHGTSRLRPEPLRRPSFLADRGLERLAAYLRLLGFDARSVTDPDCDGAVLPGSTGRHTLLCRREAAVSGVERVLRVCAAKPRSQAAEVVTRLQLQRLISPLSRCLACNGEWRQPGIPATCGRCGRIYRDGIHRRRLVRLAERLAAHCQKAQEKPGDPDVGYGAVSDHP